VNLPSGASIKETKEVMAGIADNLYGDNRVSSFSTYVGDSAPRFILLFDPLAPEDSHGQMILVEFVSLMDAPEGRFTSRMISGRTESGKNSWFTKGISATVPAKIAAVPDSHGQMILVARDSKVRDSLRDDTLAFIAEQYYPDRFLT